MSRVARWARSAQRLEGEAAFVVVLALQSASIFLVTPLEATGALMPPVVDLIRFAVAAAVVLIVAKRTVTRALIVLAFVATMVASTRWNELTPLARPLITLLFDGTVAVLVAAATFQPGRVSTRRILGAVILYLYIALIFANLYRVAGYALAQAFASATGGSAVRFVDLLRFSLATLTTAGGADIRPVHPLAQSLASLEAVLGQLFPATLLGRLVTLHAAGGES